ncbi:CAP domain-containing protein [Flavobacterium oncorhynchi]|uniref:CAP domain-containing protein n=1 Tax=Flavobacterium oncorhynchi TaxID=728056 RepID=UPI00351A7D23
MTSFSISCSSDDSSTTDQPVPETMDYNFNPEELETMTLINTYRTSIGLKTLLQNKHISYKAEEHNNYMIYKNVPSHDDFDKRFDNIIKVVKAIKVGENIAYNYNSPKGALDAWLLSPEHKKIIQGDYTHFGISIRQSATNKKYYTNIFVKIINP